jgi:hypothetical protein
MLAALLNLARDRQKRFQFFRNAGRGVVALDPVDQFVVAAQMFRGCRAVR